MLRAQRAVQVLQHRLRPARAGDRGGVGEQLRRPAAHGRSSTDSACGTPVRSCDATGRTSYAVGYSALAYAAPRVPIDACRHRALAAATGFYSTAADLVTLLRRALPRRRAAAERRRPSGRCSSAMWDAGDDGERYALGLGTQTDRRARLIGHGGGFPGHITCSVADPAARLAVSVLTNAIDGPARAARARRCPTGRPGLRRQGPGRRGRRRTEPICAGSPAGSRAWGVSPTSPCSAGGSSCCPRRHRTPSRTPSSSTSSTTRRCGWPATRASGRTASRSGTAFAADGSVESLRASSGMTLSPLDRFRLGDRVGLA